MLGGRERAPVELAHRLTYPWPRRRYGDSLRCPPDSALLRVRVSVPAPAPRIRSAEQATCPGLIRAGTGTDTRRDGD